MASTSTSTSNFNDSPAAAVRRRRAQQQPSAVSSTSVTSGANANGPRSDTTTPVPPSPNAGKGKSKKRKTNLKLSGFKEAVDDGTEELTLKVKSKGKGEYKIVAPGTPWDEIDLSQVPFLKHTHHKPHRKTWKAWLVGRKFFFPAGILLGVLLAYALSPLSNIPPEIMFSLTGKEPGEGAAFSTLARVQSIFAGMSLPDFPDFDELTANLAFMETAKNALTNRDFHVGNRLLKDGYKKKHPVILVPGIVSTGLESWGTSEDAKGFFRKRLWGTTTMIQAVLSDKNRWVDALSLDPVTGLDPAGYRVRAAQGLDAASEFIQGYWVWQKIVQNLAALGYDPNSLEMAAYDWRLAYYNLEVRDAFFSRLKSKVELYRRTNDQKVILCSHSMGGTVMMFFLKWVEAMPEDDIDGMGFGGGGGPQWVEENVEAVINVAGTLLGVAKSMTAFLSGEMKDTVEIHPAGSWVLEKMFSRRERAKLFRKWPGSTSMWMKGGDRIWGNQESAPDDPENATDTHGKFFSFRRESDMKAQAETSTSMWANWASAAANVVNKNKLEGKSNSSDEIDEKDKTTSSPPKESELNKDTVWPNLTMNEAGTYVLSHTPNMFQRMYESNYSNGFETDTKVLHNNRKNHRKWTNPLEVQLPNAPSLKIFCLYGHGKETERSYWYVQGEYEQDEGIVDGPSAQCETADDPDPDNMNVTQSGMTCRTPLDLPLSRKHRIDTEVNTKGSIPEVRSGVKFGEGDGTVPLLSLGAMCVRGWQDKRWNPAGIKVITQEFKHEPEGLDLRGGPKTGDHIDILGSTALNEAIVRIAAGDGDEMEDHIVSNIRRYADNIDWD